jgi:hypothetical protein
MMQEHMTSNIRDHLLALQNITRKLAYKKYDEAADIATKRAGMPLLKSHGANHMGKFMPREIAAIGTSMHRSASRFAITVRYVDANGAGLKKNLAHCLTLWDSA